MDVSSIPLFLCVLLTVFVLFFIVWYVMSVFHYSWVLLKPGDTYMIAGNKHVMPNVDSYGPSYLLKDDFVRELRGLVTKVGSTLQRMNIEWWVTGGTLLGTEMFQTIPMPFDDDVDIGVPDKYRALLFSQAFVEEAKNDNLRVIYLRGASSKNATRVGACVRCQLEGCTSTLDIFFWKTLENKVVKLDGWRNGLDIENEKEQFALDDVYPIQSNVAFDGLRIGLPQNPSNLLKTQYGPKVFERSIARSLFVSHASPFVLLKAMWTSMPPG